MDPEKLNNEENPKRNIYRSSWEGEIENLLRKFSAWGWGNMKGRTGGGREMGRGRKLNK